MISMSGVRNTFWHVVTRGRGWVSAPAKYGLSGCIPATVNSAEGSCSAGTSEPEGSRRWPLRSKYSRNVLRISSEVMGFCSVGRVSGPSDRAPADDEVAVHQARQLPGSRALCGILEGELQGAVT